MPYLGKSRDADHISVLVLQDRRKIAGRAAPLLSDNYFEGRRIASLMTNLELLNVSGKRQGLRFKEVSDASAKDLIRNTPDLYLQIWR